MDELLGPPPGSHTFDNEWQLLAARLGGDWATCKGLAPPPPLARSLALLPLPLICSQHLGFLSLTLIFYSPISSLNVPRVHI